MGLDKFGRASSSSSASSSLAHAEKKLMRNSPVSFTTDGNIDCENRRLCNVKAPHANVDVTNKKYVDEKICTDLQNIKADFQTAYNDLLKNMTTFFLEHLTHHEKLLDETKSMWNVRFEKLVEKFNNIETTQKNDSDAVENLQKDMEKMTASFREHLTQQGKLLDGMKQRWNVRFEELVQKVNKFDGFHQNDTNDTKYMKKLKLK